MLSSVTSSTASHLNTLASFQGITTEGGKMDTAASAQARDPNVQAPPTTPATRPGQLSQAERATQIATSGVTSEAGTQPRQVVNAQGDMTGTLISTTA